ncbi:MAG: hypothetical protein KME45_12875 [Stenomitos rutilans HA7619-LM2]|jgi:hypothetical protein|nr:hypothetical protein [Stenomitos rutilans HA7619-LM2]
MDSRERRRLISIKASANRQRRNRALLLESLSPSISATLRTARCVYTPESDLVIAGFLPISALGIRSGTQTRSVHYCPVYYSFTKVACSQKALTFVQQIDGVAPNTLSYLSIGTVGKYPAFVVEAGWAQSVFSYLWSIADDFIAVVGCQFEFGMVIDHYCGYLEDDYNSNEIVYEVARWLNFA